MTLENRIRTEAFRLGFQAVGFARAEFLEPEARYLESWLSRQAHGQMGYMERNFDLRTDPRKLVPGAKTVISLAFNYFPPPSFRPKRQGFKISKYAYGKDYHFVLKKKLNLLLEFIQQAVGSEVSGRVFVDSAPVLEKAWARRSGLGWVGKNTNLLRQRTGSFFFLSEIILDVGFQPDAPATDHCGSCRRCLDACPTQALKPYEIDASRCISYLTIELRENLPETFVPHLEGWAFGCDICQDVCPWNQRFASPHTEAEFEPLVEILEATRADWENLTNTQFNKRLRPSAMSRIGKTKWLDNMEKAEAPLRQNPEKIG